MSRDKVVVVNKSLCILPFVHMSITPNGFVRLCCQAEEDVAQNDVPMSLYVYSIEDIWNSGYMQKVRREMVAGNYLPACSKCIASEKQGTGSYRTFSNKEWSEQIGPFEELIISSKINGYKVNERPVSFHLVTGNACNLKCRMCNPIFSSKVARDNVQRKWCLSSERSEPKALIWGVGRNILGPDIVLGIETKGFYPPEYIDNKVLRWTKGDASLTFRVPQGLKVGSIILRVAGCYPVTQKLKVFVNDHVLSSKRLIFNQFLYKRRFSKGPVELELKVLEKVSTGPITIRLKSGTFSSQNDHRTLGVAIENIEVWCESSTAQVLGRQQVTSKIEHVLPDVPWYEQNDWIACELFKNCEQLKGIHFSGGEPMVQKQVEDIIDFCVERDIAKNIYLQFNLNCTVVPDRMVAKLSNFKRLFLALSIDGYGPWWEYIRYPGKWSITKNNIEKLVQLPEVRIMFVPVLMVYNILNILELFSYANRIGVDCLMYPLTTPPTLDVSILPARIRQIAAERFRDFAQQSSTKLTYHHLIQVADYLESLEDKCTEESLRTFMLFTNDLDAGRGQSFPMLHAELLSLLEESGFRWTNEKRYA